MNHKLQEEPDGNLKFVLFTENQFGWGNRLGRIDGEENFFSGVLRNVRDERIRKVEIDAESSKLFVGAFWKIKLPYILAYKSNCLLRVNNLSKIGD
jgi:hypothetical protein